MQKTALVILLALAATTTFVLFHAEQDQTVEEIFAEWKQKHGLMLDLSTQQQAYRLKIFQKNLQAINQHNSKPGQSYRMGVNKFTAITQEEFEHSFLTNIQPNPVNPNIVQEQHEKLKLNVDWVSYGAVSPVKDQGTCGASYAFSAVGAIEGLSVVVYSTVSEYSVQQIIDCTASYGNQGCNTGNMLNSFNFVRDKGIQTESVYPYTGKVGTCRFAVGLFRIRESGAISKGVCSSMEAYLIMRPVSVAVDGQNFAKYSSGIFDNCGNNLSLAALLVGGTNSYYKLKLSWGTSWGEGGYIRLLRTTDYNNICGICDAASVPIPF